MVSTTKKIWVFLGLILMLAGLAGCGGASAPKSEAARPASPAFQAQPQGQFPGSPPPAPEAASGSFSDEAPAKAPPADAPSGGAARRESERASREPAPEQRPGLGTEWGETRTSRTHDVSFVRDSSRPFAVASLHYNDRRGVEALASVQAKREVRRDLPIGGGAVTVSIRDASGSPLEAVRAGDKTLVVGQAGQRYSIVLTNHTSHRFESVVTVDGLDVINGKQGSMDNRGYVLLPFATLEIEGFRQSASAVAAFRFAAVSESYAAQMGTARNVGVIGVAFFNERGDAFVDENELRLRDTATPFPADPRFAQPPRR